MQAVFVLVCEDIHANHFWEAIGFLPIAFRTGSRKKQRIHIFWQKRVHEGDVTTPYWYPYETKSGQIGEDRLVFPIPPDVNWRDAKPAVLPGVHPDAELKPLAIPDKHKPAEERPRIPYIQKVETARSNSKHLQGVPKGKVAVVTGGKIRYIDRADYVPEPVVKPKKPPRAAQKNDPVLAAKDARPARSLSGIRQRGEKCSPSACEYLVHRPADDPDDTAVPTPLLPGIAA